MNLDNLIWVDYAIVGIIVLSALIGLIRGLVREALSLIAWVLAIWVALSFAGDLAPLFAERIAAESVRVMVAFTVLFLVTLIIAAIINYMISQLVDKTGLSGTDHLLGAIFGVARGAFLVAVLLMLANATLQSGDTSWKQSQLTVHFEGLALWVHDLLPPDIAAKLDPDKVPGEPVKQSGNGFSFPLNQAEDAAKPAVAAPAASAPVADTPVVDAPPIIPATP